MAERSESDFLLVAGWQTVLISGMPFLRKRSCEDQESQYQFRRSDIDGKNAVMADLGIACELNGGGACLRIARVGKTRQGRVDKQKTRAPALPPSQGSWRPNGMSKTRWRWEVGFEASRLQGWQPADQGPGLKCQVIDWCYVAAVNIWSLQRSSACGREMERCRLRSRCVMRSKKKDELLI